MIERPLGLEKPAPALELGPRKKADYAAKHIYDVWFPVLAPTEPLLKEFFPIDDDGAWRSFKRRFLAEMKQPDAARTLDLLAALSHGTDFSVGCYCEREERCHRSILRELLEKRGARIGVVGHRK